MSDPVRPGRPEAAAAIWSLGPKPDRRAHVARRSASIRFVVALAAGGVLYALERPIMAAVAASLGSLSLLLALASPLGAYAALDRLVTRTGALVGTILTWLLLAPVFYLFFVPFGLLFRRGARDPLRRAIDRDAPSYWTKRASDPPRLDRPY